MLTRRHDELKYVNPFWSILILEKPFCKCLPYFCWVRTFEENVFSGLKRMMTHDTIWVDVNISFQHPVPYWQSDRDPMDKCIFWCCVLEPHNISWPHSAWTSLNPTKCSLWITSKHISYPVASRDQCLHPKTSFDFWVKIRDWSSSSRSYLIRNGFLYPSDMCYLYNI